MNLLCCQITILFLPEIIIMMDLAHCKSFLMLQCIYHYWWLFLFMIEFCHSMCIFNQIKLTMFSYRYAYQVLVGDKVMVLRNNKLFPAKVKDVSSFIVQGNYSSSNCLHWCYFFFGPMTWVVDNWGTNCSLSLLLLLNIHLKMCSSLSRGICSSNIRWEHYSWWSIGLMLCLFQPWPGSDLNETYAVVSKYSTMDIWRGRWISYFCQDC